MTVPITPTSQAHYENVIKQCLESIYQRVWHMVTLPKGHSWLPRPQGYPKWLVHRIVWEEPLPALEKKELGCLGLLVLDS